MNPVLAALSAITLIGLIVRGIPIALADFPVNDGGLFFAMTRALQAGWTLPVSVDWNGTELPFTYPPLGLYLAGLTDAGLGIDLIATFRILPLVASSLVVPGVYLLGRSLLRSNAAGLAAALTYALTPTAFIWLVQGGGVTRAPGMLLAVLTIWQSVELVRRPSPARAAITGVLAGLTILTHPAAALFTAISAALIWIFEGRTRRSFALSTGALGLALLVASPWAFAVVQHHGLAGLLDVQNNGPDPRSTLIALLVGRLTGNPFVDPLALLGLGMAILCVVRSRFLLPVWLLAAALLAWQYAMVPFAMLVAVAVVDLSSLRDTPRRCASGATAQSLTGPSKWVPSIGLGLIGIVLLVEAGAAGAAILNSRAPLHALSPERRDAMVWVDANVENVARFAIVTGDSWAVDPDSEWFPALSQRVSVATVQGSEWLGRAAFRAQLTAYGELQDCVDQGTAACVRGWLAEWPADFIFIPKGQRHGPNSLQDCCAELRADLLMNPSFVAVHDDNGATIFRIDGPSSGASVLYP